MPNSELHKHGVASRIENVLVGELAPGKEAPHPKIYGGNPSAMNNQIIFKNH